MKKDMPLEGLRWSRDSGSALYDTPQNGRSRTGWGGDCPRTQIPIGGNLQIESERPDDMGKTSESLAELGGNQSGYAQEISNRKFETPSNGVIGRPGGRPSENLIREANN